MSVDLSMHTEMEIPSTLPVMTLRDTVFFPQSILPLHVFEARYRVMLKDVLAGNRLFVVARLDEGEEGEEESAYSVATVGMVRASHENPDGTSNLVLQGLCRVRIGKVLAESPYRCASILPEITPMPNDPEAVAYLKSEIADLLLKERDLANDVPREFLEFLQTIEDLDVFIDLVAYSACPCADLKQRMLETLDLESRYGIYLRYLHRRMERSRFFRKLQGVVADDDITLN